jgi:hypothetical protein
MGMFSILSSYAEIDQGTIVGAWLFDEGQGNAAKDSSGNGRDGEIQGAAKWVNGQFGKALEFNGQDAWVEVPEIGTFDEVTITVWVNVTGRVGQWRVLINNNGWKAGDVHHQLHTNNRVEFSIHSNPGGNDTFGNLLFDNSRLDEWHHLATVYSSGESKISFYVDGELDNEQAWGGNQAVLGPARIGSWDGGGREWQGLMDDFIIFSVALGNDDIQSLMEKGLAGMTSVELSGKLTTRWGSLKARHYKLSW